MHNKGLSLIELIIYVAISSIVLVSVVSFAWHILGSGTRINVSSELTQNGRCVLEKISRDIRNANDITTASSIFDTDPGVLVLDTDNGALTFDTYQKNITVGTQNITIRKLRRNGIDMTSDKINVTHFLVENLTRATESKNVNISLGLEFVNPGNDFKRNRSLSLEPSVTIRKTQ